jgi:hypothetical protein
VYGRVHTYIDTHTHTHTYLFEALVRRAVVAKKHPAHTVVQLLDDRAVPPQPRSVPQAKNRLVTLHRVTLDEAV